MGDGLRVGVFGDFGIFSTIGYVRTKAAVEDFDAIAEISDVLLGLGLEFGGVEFAGFFQGNSVRVFRFDGGEEFANLDVRTKAADVGFNVLPVFGLADDARQFEHF